MTSLVEYSDSGSNSETETQFDEQKSKKAKLSPSALKEKRKGNLPLPESITKLYNHKTDERDDLSKHNGRIRTFGHEKGNWATSVYIPYEEDEDFKDVIEELLLCLSPLEFHMMEDFHISLSRTVSIRHHWIQSLIDSLQAKVTSLSSFPCELDTLKFYVNDEKTRSFLGIEVISPSDELKKYVDVVDQCYKDYKLPTYYKEPSFHISIAWCLGDITCNITDDQMTQLQEIWKTACGETPEMRYLFVKQFECKTGNKKFQFCVENT